MNERTNERTNERETFFLLRTSMEEKLLREKSLKLSSEVASKRVRNKSEQNIHLWERNLIEQVNIITSEILYAQTKNIHWNSH